MDIVKKNLVSIICGVVAILAMVAVFVWPFNGFYEKLNTKAKDRVETMNKAEQLINKKYVVPVFDPRDPSATEYLKEFPNQNLINAAEKAQKAMDKQSEGVYQKAVELNKAGHALITPDVLPRPTGQPALLGFRTKYEMALEKLRNEELKSGVPPTNEERARRLRLLQEELLKQRMIVQGKVINQEELQAKLTAAAARLPGEMSLEMATKYKMYVDPTKVLKVKDTVPAKDAPRLDLIWWCQMEYWVYADVVAAIKAMNANASNVTEAPIKNLTEFDVPWSYFPPPAAATGSSTSGDQFGGTPTIPGGGAPDPTIAVPDGSAQSPTRHISNSLYDVVHFNLTVHIESDKVLAFLAQLGTGKYITVLKVDMESLDPELIKAQDYIYGPRPVVKLVLECEELFMRDWTQNLMPQTMRDAMGIPAPARPTNIPR